MGKWCLLPLASPAPCAAKVAKLPVTATLTSLLQRTGAILGLLARQADVAESHSGSLSLIRGTFSVRT